MVALDSESSSDKKRLLMIFPLDMAAHYLRCLELSRKINNQFEILFACSLKYEKFVRNYGFKTFEVDNFDSEEITASASHFDFSWLNAPNIERVLTSQTKVIGEYRPDLVLGDAAFTLKMAAEKASVPYISLLNGYMTRYYSITRQVSHSHPAYAYSKTMPKRVFERLTRIIEHIMFEKVHAPFRRVRRKLGLSKLSFLLEELEGDLNLICDLPNFFPQKNLPLKYEFVGPLFYDGNEEEKEIVDFFGDRRPNILVTLGSTGNWENLHTLQDPLFNEFRIVVSGNGCDTIQGDNILSKAFVNQTRIMDKVDIVICHGGNGTIYQALSRGVPLLFFPGNFEQEWNIQRAVEMKLGARLEEGFGASKIRELVDGWISKRRGDVFCEVQQSIKSFVDKPVVLSCPSTDTQGILKRSKDKKN